MKQKKIMIIILLILGLVVNSYCVSGHPASNVDLKYDFDNQILNATISHNTDDTNTHFIEKVEVYKNGVTIIEENYISQPSSNTFTLSFDVSTNDGDVLKVETECSISGKTQDSITVKSEGDGISTEKDDTSTPGFGLLITTLGITLFIILKRKRK